jgi:hypothetical protein
VSPRARFPGEKCPLCQDPGCGMEWVDARWICSRCYAGRRIRDLSRTAAALDAHDQHERQWSTDALMRMSNAQAARLYEEREKLARAVGVAFGLDTDRATGGPNDPQVCADLIRPGPIVPPAGMEPSFVRRMVRLWQTQSTT